MVTEAAVAPLPPLRQDLALHAGPAAPDGSPTWTLHDPAANRFYELRWAAFELLARWSLGTPAKVIAAVRRETTLEIGEDDVEQLIRMLTAHHLIVAHSARDTDRLNRAAAAARLSPAMWLLKHYLFVRVPLVQPMPWLRRLAPHVGWAFRSGFWAAVAVAAILGLALASQRWDEFTHTFAAYAGWSGALAIAGALSMAKVLHELGHAFTAHRYGCRVPTMGVAFMVLWPVLYTDTNEAWKLSSRRQRLAIGAAGMLCEIALAAFATLVWALLPGSAAWGPVRAAAFLLATTTWVLTLAINASPFMRFDGYFLLCDAINVPNLHPRSFALARWWLRERLFGWGDAPPEGGFTPSRQRFLIAFAFATWLYRMVLFIGIAVLVYHLFFKALGLLMMAVELGWFVAAPVAREFAYWRSRRGSWRWNRATRRLALALLGTALVLLWPWQSTVRAPAVFAAMQVQGLYAPHAARVAGALPTVGERLRQGEALVHLQSPELSAQLELARAREEQLRWQVSQQTFDARLLEAGAALHSRWEAAREEVEGLQREVKRLTLVMPFDGTVVESSEDVTAGTWVAAGEKLLQVVGPQGARVEAFVDESELQRLNSGGAGVFVPDTPERPHVRCTRSLVDAVQLVQLDHVAVASLYGGGIAAQRRADGRVVPLQPTFRVRLEGCDVASPPRSEVTGVAILHGERQSLAAQGLQRLAALWRREAAL